MSERQDQQKIQSDQQQKLSSSLSYLKNPQNGDQQASQGDLKRKNIAEKDSQIKKVLINNRRKQKTLQSDSTYDGIYLYKPGVQLPSLYQFSNQSIKIIIASEYIKKQNPQLLRRNIYGTQTYTSNSDAVCILVHCGYVNLNTFSSKRLEGIQLTCKVIKPKKNYTGSTKYGLTSRSIKGYNGNALKPQSYKNMYSLCSIQLLERYASNMHIPIGKNRVKSKPKNLCNITPIPETHIVFNMHNQPAYKYSLFNLADKGYQKNEFLIKKLDQMVLYLETSNREKYQLVKKCQKEYFDSFKFSKLLHPQRHDNQMFSKEKCPLSDDSLEKIQESLEWDQIRWGNQSVEIKGKVFDGLRSFKFYKKQK